MCDYAGSAIKLGLRSSRAAIELVGKIRRLRTHAARAHAEHLGAVWAFSNGDQHTTVCTERAHAVYGTHRIWATPVLAKRRGIQCARIYHLARKNVLYIHSPMYVNLPGSFATGAGPIPPPVMAAQRPEKQMCTAQVLLVA